MPTDVVKWIPKVPAILDKRLAIPVNPLGSSPTGSRNVFMANACSKADAITAAAVIKSLFFILLSFL